MVHDKTTNTCVPTRHDCGENIYFCQNLTCIDYVGCKYVPRNCGLNATDHTDCATYNCSETEKKCTRTNPGCSSVSYAGVIAGIISAVAAIVTLVVLLFIASALSSTASAISLSSEVPIDTTVHNNPLYTPKYTFKENPLGV